MQFNFSSNIFSLDYFYLHLRYIYPLEFMLWLQTSHFPTWNDFTSTCIRISCHFSFFFSSLNLFLHVNFTSTGKLSFIYFYKRILPPEVYCTTLNLSPRENYLPSTLSLHRQFIYPTPLPVPLPLIISGTWLLQFIWWGLRDTHLLLLPGTVAW